MVKRVEFRENAKLFSPGIKKTVRNIELSVLRGGLTLLLLFYFLLSYLAFFLTKGI